MPLTKEQLFKKCICVYGINKLHSLKKYKSDRNRNNPSLELHTVHIEFTLFRTKHMSFIV